MYLVTGSSGNVGREVVRQLLSRGETVRVFVRDPGKVTEFLGRVEIAEGDFRSPASFAQALKDITAVYLMNGRSSADVMQSLLQAAKPRRGQRMVFQSTIFADDPSSSIGQIHRLQEEAVKDAGWLATILRPTAFMSNAYQYIDSITHDGVVYNSMGDGRFAPIAPADVAAVGVLALTDPAHVGQLYHLTGGESVTVPEMVRILSEIWHREIRCVDTPVEVVVEGMIRRGLTPAMAHAVGQSHSAVRDGRAVLATNTVERLIRRPPISFRTWATGALKSLSEIVP